MVRGILSGSGLTMERNSRASIVQWPVQSETTFIMLTDNIKMDNI